MSIFGAGTIACAFVYGYTRGQKRIDITKLALPLAEWPQPWQGLKLLHLSDLHIGTNLNGTELRDYIHQANALNPDIIFLTGRYNQKVWK